MAKLIKLLGTDKESSSVLEFYVAVASLLPKKYGTVVFEDTTDFPIYIQAGGGLPMVNKEEIEEALLYRGIKARGGSIKAYLSESANGLIFTADDHSFDFKYIVSGQADCCGADVIHSFYLGSDFPRKTNAAVIALILDRIAESRNTSQGTILCQLTHRIEDETFDAVKASSKWSIDRVWINSVHNSKLFMATANGHRSLGDLSPKAKKLKYSVV